jgi:hypothetical protein
MVCCQAGMRALSPGSAALSIFPENFRIIDVLKKNIRD